MTNGDLDWIANYICGMADYSRLVSDVVTGKLDVRQAAADLDERAVTDGIGDQGRRGSKVVLPATLDGVEATQWDLIERGLGEAA